MWELVEELYQQRLASRQMRLRSEFRDVDYEMAGRELTRMFYDSVIKQDLANRFDKYMESPCFERAIDIVEAHPEFRILFLECRPGGVITIQEAVRSGGKTHAT